MRKGVHDLSSGNLVKPRSLSFEDGNCIVRSLMKKWIIHRSHVNRFEIGPTLSLIDEISIVFDADGLRFFVAETDLNFWDLMRWLNVDKALGGDWYQKAEAGEHFVVN